MGRKGRPHRLSGAVTAAFQYDGEGRRSTKTVKGNTTALLYDGLDILQTSSGGLVASRLTGLSADEVFLSSKAGVSRVPMVDALGSTVALTESNGAIQTQYSYDSYGATKTSGAIDDYLTQYTGRENDDTGLYGYRNRYYDAQSGRFVSEDVLGVMTGANLYAYVDDNPLQFSDPLGLAAGDTRHPPADVSYKCRRGEPCVLLATKIAVFETLIAGHLALDIATNQGGRHAEDIASFEGGLAKCKRYFDNQCNCRIGRPRPMTKAEQRVLLQLTGWLELLALLPVIILM